MIWRSKLGNENSKDLETVPDPLSGDSGVDRKLCYSVTMTGMSVNKWFNYSQGTCFFSFVTILKSYICLFLQQN